MNVDEMITDRVIELMVNDGEIPIPQPDDSLSTIRELFMASMLSGHNEECACCGRFAKFYPRRLEGQWVLQLQYIASCPYGALTKEIQNSIPESLIDRSNGMRRTFALLRHWGLIEKMVTSDHRYKITPLGMDFLNGKSIPSVAILYNNDVIFHSSELVTWRDIIGNRFDLAELMMETCIDQLDLDDFVTELSSVAVNPKTSLMGTKTKSTQTSIVDMLTEKVAK